MKTSGASRRDPVLSAAEMRALEAEAFASGRLSSRAAMATAGAGVVAALGEARPGLAARPGRAVVLCGPGNNGGDGYVAAGLLARQGWQVAVFALGNPERLPPDARHFHDAWAASGPVRPLAQAPAALAGADLVIDALFGIGLARGLDPEVLAVLAVVPATAFRVAVDVPSGRDTDTGAVLGGGAFDADLAVTFHAEKPVHRVLREAGVAVAVADIGL